MNVLFVTKHNPFGVGGGSLATFSFVKLFLQISNNNFDLVMAEECYSEEYLKIGIRNKYLVPPRSLWQIVLEYPRGIFHRYNNYVRKNKILDNNYDYVILDNSSVSSTFVKFAKKKKIKTITIHHNYEPEYYIADNKSFWKYLFLPLVKRNEKNAYKNSFINLFLTEADKKKFYFRYGDTKSKNICCFFMLKEVVEVNIIKKYDVAITCSLENYQNVRCITKFLCEYKNSLLDFNSILIAGKNPSEDLVSYINKFSNIELIQNPIDMEQLLQLSHIYICPIEDGGGIKVRCLDAISNLMPVIIHRNSIRGYEVFKENGLFFEYFDLDSFKTAIVNARALVDDESFKKRYRQVIKDNFTIDSAIMILDKIGVSDYV